MAFILDVALKDLFPCMEIVVFWLMFKQETSIGFDNGFLPFITHRCHLALMTKETPTAAVNRSYVVA